MKNDLYLLKFDPILKEKIWGGRKLQEKLHKNSPSKQTGESWEITDVEGDSSVISNGSHKGKTLNWLLNEYKEELVGKKVFEKFGAKFPLLIKFIDAAETLSIQLHPDDKIAKEKHDSFGKTEMWYIMQADENAELILGFKNQTSKDEYQALVDNKQLPEALNREKVKTGDAFIINPGLIHAIGAGVMLAEIQQTSDITYRVYDWDRTSNEGEKRDLHTAMALDAIDVSNNKDFKLNYELEPNSYEKLAESKYFKTNILSVNDELSRDYSKFDSFVILMCVEGEAMIKTADYQEELLAGQTLLIPASLKEIEIKGKNSKILEVSV